MASIDNLVHQTTSGTGTGSLTLAAVNGKRSFNTAFGNGATPNVFYYFISNRSASEWEIGTGSMSDATTLSRDTVLYSSNGGSLVNFTSGTKDVTNDLPANLQVSVGDVLTKADNLGSVASPATAFANIKQAASDTETGVVELATDAEAETGTDTARAVTPANASAVYIKKSLLTTRGDIITRGASAPQRLAVGAANRVLTSDGTDPNWAQIAFAMLASGAYIASGEFRAATASKLLTAAGVWSDADFASLTDAASITLDMSLMATLASVALAGNRTLSNPSNTKNGQFFAIKVTASTSTRTLTLGANYVVAAGVEAFPISILTTETVYVIGFIESASVARITAVVRY